MEGGMERNLEAHYLTTADVGRRLGIQGGAVRHYGKLLRERGYPFAQGENEEWLWPPEVVEVARAAHALAKGVKGLTFEGALDLLEYAGRIALKARPGTTLPEVMERIRGLPQALERASGQLEDTAAKVERRVQEAVRRLEASVNSQEQRLQGAARSFTEGVVEALAEARQQASTLGMGWWVGPVLVLLQGLVLSILVGLTFLGGGVDLGSPWVRLGLLVGPLSLVVLGYWMGKSR